MAMESKSWKVEGGMGREGGKSMREGKKVNFGLEKFKKNNYSKHNNMTESCQKNLICVRRATHTQWEKLRRTFASGTTWI